MDPKAHDDFIKKQITSHLESELIPFLLSLQSVKDVIRILEITPIKEKLWGTPENDDKTLTWLARLHYDIGNIQKSIELIESRLGTLKESASKKYFEGIRQQKIESLHKK